MSRPRDLVLFGATSFVGELLSQVMLARHGVDRDVRWAIAGRSAPKLEELRRSLGAEAASLPIMIADASDEGALRELCASTRAVISTVGPYAKYGEPLVKVCASSGTDYLDLTGETPWLARMIRRYHDDATRSGARLISCCGFDSIPSDLGVHFLQREAVRRHGRPLSSVKMRLVRVGGGISGGTIASGLEAVREAVKDPAARRVLADPYVLCPDDASPRVRQPDVRAPELDRDLDAWVAPFIMATINTRVVHRTNALTGHAYGTGFRYGEAVRMGRGPRGLARAVGMTAGLGAVAAAAAVPPGRWLLEQVLPAPGEGPSPEAQQRGHFEMVFIGHDDDGRSLRARVRGDRDPGYSGTARMLAEAGLCLVHDVSRDEKPGGFWTPASALGDKLVERLTRWAGMSFEIVDDRADDRVDDLVDA